MAFSLWHFRCLILDFHTGQTFVISSEVDEGAELILNCVTGSVFYPANETKIQWRFSNSKNSNWEIMNNFSQEVEHRPQSLEPNNSTEIISTYTTIAKRELNGKLVKCRLLNGQQIVDSDTYNLTIYCKSVHFCDFMTKLQY